MKKTRTFTISIEVELPIDDFDGDEYISDEGWEQVNSLHIALDALRYEYRHEYIKHISGPRSKS
jgi:hypothetical protein